MTLLAQTFVQRKHWRVERIKIVSPGSVFDDRSRREKRGPKFWLASIFRFGGRKISHLQKFKSVSKLPGKSSGRRKPRCQMILQKAKPGVISGERRVPGKCTRVFQALLNSKKRGC